MEEKEGEEEDGGEVEEGKEEIGKWVGENDEEGVEGREEEELDGGCLVLG